MFSNSIKSILLILYLIGFSVNLSAQNWSNDIAALVYEKCSFCHHQDAIAPFNLMSYQDVQQYSPLIPHAINEGSMPPWLPDPKYTHFADEYYLTDSEKGMLLDWINSGMPPGDLSQAPAPPVYLPSGSLLDTIHHTVSFGAYTLQSNNDEYRWFVIPNNYTDTVYLNKVEVIPGLDQIVHHADLYYDVTNTSMNFDLQDPAPGFNQNTGYPNLSRYINAWSPGANPARYPDGWSVPVPPGADFVMEIHFGPGGIGQLDSTIMNLEFTDASSATREVQVGWLLTHYSPSLIDGPLFIEADSVKFFHQKSDVLTKDYSFISVAPHMHLLGKSYKIWALTPQGDTIRMIDIPNWDFHWQRYYYWPNPLKLPQGTVIYSRASFDNTMNNHDQPNNPPINVSLGSNTDDEMLLAYFMFTEYEPGDETIVMGDTIADEVILTMNEVADKASFDMKLFPNPVQDQLTLTGELEQADRFHIKILSSTGKLVAEEKVDLSAGAFNHQMDVCDLVRGVYYVSCKGAHYGQVIPFIKRE